MRKTGKALFAAAVLSLAILLVPACAPEATPAPTPAPTAAPTEVKVYKIGITQIVTHPALDAVREGFIQSMADGGFVEGENVEYDYRNPEGDMSTTQTIAQKFVNDKVDLILSIATPTSQACVNAAEGTGIPVVFSAVTDPVAAGLVSNWEKPGENVTGVSDMIDVKSDVELILEIAPGVKKLGTLYNAGETNSVVLADELKEICPGFGIEVLEATVSTSADVQAAAQSLAGRVDAIWVGTDNTVVSGLEALIKICEDNKIPFFPSDDPSIKRGGVACMGFDYYDVGIQTGEMAAKILKGTNPGDIPVELAKKLSCTVNTKAAERFEVTIPQEILDKALTVYTE